MQSERVTFLTSPRHKAALTARAAAQGISLGEYVRRRTDEDEGLSPDQEAELAMLVTQVNEAIPQMNAMLDDMIDTLRQTSAAVQETLGELGAAA